MQPESLHILDYIPQLLANPLPRIVLCSVTILWGLLDCFLGYRIFKASVIVIGAIFMSMAVGEGITSIFPQMMAVQIGAYIGGFFVGLILSWFLYKVGVFIMGMWLGATLVLPFAAHINSVLAVLLLFVAALSFGILTLMIMDVMIILATSVTGAMRVILGIAALTGAISAEVMQQQSETASHFSADLNFNLDIRYSICLLVLGVLGFFFQYRRYLLRQKQVSDA